MEPRVLVLLGWLAFAVGKGGREEGREGGRKEGRKEGIGMRERTFSTVGLRMVGFVLDVLGMLR